MTSRSPKSRPTTAWATTARATATSLLAALAATAAVAQTPLPSVPSAASPAKTTWQAFPTDPPAVVPSPAAAPPTMVVSSPAPTAAPAPMVAPAPTAAPPGQPAIGTRVVVYQKPAGGDRPVARQDEPKKDPAPKREPEPKKEPPDPLAPKAKPTTYPADPKPTDLRLMDDKQLDAELIRTYNAQQLEAYNRSTEENKQKPKPIGRETLPPSEKVRELLTQAFPPAAPRSVLGAPVSTLQLEPGYVVHRRLYFEEKNSERYGWNLGIAQPFVSAGYFYKDLLLYPMKLASNPRERYDTNAGKAMAGSPVPYLLYPPELTFGGMVVGSTAYVGAIFLLP